MICTTHAVRVRGALQWLAVVRAADGTVIAHCIRWSEPFARRDAEAKAHAVGHAETLAMRSICST